MSRFLLCLLTAGMLVGGSGNQTFQDGDVVGFWGDSITHAGYSEINYTHVLNNYYVTHYPEREIEIRNLGVGGAKASHGLYLYEKDPSAKGVTKVFLEYGINDLQKYFYEDPELYEDGEEEREQNLQEFRENLDAFLELLKKEGIENDSICSVSLPIPNTLTEEDIKNENISQIRLQDGYDNMSDVVREFAQETGVGFLELREPLTEMWKTLYSEDPDPEHNIMEDDWIHLNAAGHIYLAYLFLEQQGALVDVSRVEIDRDGISSDDAEVSNLHFRDGYLYYDYQAQRLPMGISHEYFEADESLHILDRMNREIIQVQDLQTDAVYDLYINGEKIGSFEGEEFSEGVNIANIRENPLQMYARAVEQMNRGRRVSELTYREVVQDFTDCGSGQTTEEELETAYQTWKEEDTSYRQGMQELVQEGIQTKERIAIVRQDMEVPDAVFELPGSIHKKAIAAVIVLGTVLAGVCALFFIRRRKRNNIDKQDK